MALERSRPLEELIAEAAQRGEMDPSLLSVDSTTARVTTTPARTRLSEDVLTCLEKAAVEEGKARSKGGSPG
ncbi:MULTISPECIES: hypothetical protein [unclassified Streptomyces]|uniref:hypothetical protein n=1 Tax=unclassified Streptomyces TaxID=2593676 RepID=UPI000B064A69|nr:MULTISPECIES: hypothetical protein [unclassified Streptomyces]